MNDRSQRTKIGSSFSSSADILSGFPQCNIYTCHIFLVNNGTELSNFASISYILVPAAIVWIMVK